jgi:hypothetical protein
MNPNEMMILSRKHARVAAKLKKAARAHFEAIKAEWEAKEILESMNPEVKSRTVNLNEVW